MRAENALEIKGRSPPSLLIIVHISYKGLRGSLVFLGEELHEYL